MAALVLSFAQASSAEPVRFSRDILPILSDNCFHCHGPDEKHREGGLRLDDEVAAKQVREARAAVVPGKSTASELVRRITSHDADEVMPPKDSKRKLTADQIALLKRWVDEGAVWGKHWAYESPQRPPLPAVKNSNWPRNEIDSFVLQRLDREGLTPSAEASPEVLIRRVYLDLIGLPPTVEEVDEFVRRFRSSTLNEGESGRGGDGEKAYSALVDKLLASPEYGERWAWEWLDAARYADTGGYQGDPERTMWPWRDWVIRAINSNQPYDQFTIDQLAGDLLPDATADQRVATAFNRNHMFNAEGGRIPEETRVENVMDRLETTGTVWLGLTIGCARCHDHKFDPISQREYYQLYAYFNNTSETGSGRSGQAAPVIEAASDEQRSKLAEARKASEAIGVRVEAEELRVFPRADGKTAFDSDEGKKLPEKVAASLARKPHQRDRESRTELANLFKDRDAPYGKLLAELNATIARQESADAAIPRVMVMDDMAQPRETFILVRGAYNKTADKVSAALPQVLPKLPEGAPNNRLGMARWLVDPQHPLTARVTVNRFWQSYFGYGLVKTVEDFGVQGERPSHPELLDWLATEFIRSGWDVKRLHKLIVTSATYRQSSHVSPTLWERDPDNRLLARGARFRMPSWMIRDVALDIAGLLVDRHSGQPTKPYQPADIWEEATFGKKTYVQDHGENLYRRSLYIYWRRIVGPTLFFDSSARQVCTVKQVRTNTPLHALTTLNDITFVEAARTLAQQVLQSASSKQDVAGAAFRKALSRNPSTQELNVLTATHARLRDEYRQDSEAARKLLAVGESPRDARLDPAEHAALTALCTMILNLDEFLTKQ